MPLKSKDKHSFMGSVKNCLNGFSLTMQNEDNFRREIFLGILALLASFVLRLSTMEFIIVLIVIALVLTSEIINTAIEKTVDLCTMEYNEIAKAAKDIAAAGVLLMCFFAVIIGIIIFVPKIINMLGGII